MDLDYSDFTQITNLPFPSPLPLPSHRFEYKATGGVLYFSYMGRSKFQELRNQTENDSFIRGLESLYLYGSSGSGKSHLLAALVCHLIKKGERVVYIPNCGELLGTVARLGNLRKALRFSFYDDADSLGEIMSANSIEDLLQFWEYQEDIFLVVDQLNALDKEDKACHDVKDLLCTMKSQHRYIFSASANEASNQLVHLKNSQIRVILFYGGMTEVSHSLGVHNMIY